MTIGYTKAFVKQAQKLSPQVRQQLQDRLAQFSKSPLHRTLHNHALKGRYKEYRSINIAGDLRALYLQKEDEAVFDALGTHSQLYG